MTRFIKRSEVIKMNNNIIDIETHMTELDLLEWQGHCENWIIIEDININDMENK